MTIAEIPFEDDRITPEAWRSRKSTTLYGRVPVLTVDGVQCAQACAMLRYAGRLSGLYPAHDPWVAFFVDELVYTVNDTFRLILPLLPAPSLPPAPRNAADDDSRRQKIHAAIAQL